MSEAKTYHGQCHCGAVRYTAHTDLDGLMDCNCSRCKRLGWILKSMPAAAFTLLSGADTMTDYRFNTDKIEHLFCSICGIESFARGQDRQAATWSCSTSTASTTLQRSTAMPLPTGTAPMPERVASRH